MANGDERCAGLRALMRIIYSNITPAMDVAGCLFVAAAGYQNAFIGTNERSPTSYPTRYSACGSPDLMARRGF